MHVSCLEKMPILFMQIMMCVLAPPVSSSVLIILVEWCARVTPGTATTASATETERNLTAWVKTFGFMKNIITVVFVIHVIIINC